jgi:murein DD-endopeptidase MepM/ murein hydrolase activator NlpD
VQHRANHRASGRHRRTEALHSHRAPSTPLASQLLGDGSRHAVLTATLIAGVGVVAVSAAATAGQAQAARTRLGAGLSPATTSASTTSPASASATAVEFGNVESVVIPPSADGTGSTLSWIAPQRKAKPVPVITAQWVNPLPEAVVTSCFGQRWGRLHAGVDLAAPDGTPIHAAGAGVVVAAGEAAGYGNAVLIDHGNGFLTHYGHLSAITVQVGQHVVAGDQIGNEGSTGHSTGPHLHFEVHQGTYKNPIEPTRWMHDQGVDIPGCVTFTNTTPTN